MFRGTEVGGLSGLSYDAAFDVDYAIYRLTRRWCSNGLRGPIEMVDLIARSRCSARRRR